MIIIYLSKDYSEILKDESKYVFIDVRTPAEYCDSTIPGAINIPVFSNEQRIEIGTIYKQIGKREAIKRGIELMGPRLSDIYQQFDDLYSREKKFVIFCARGGMRSSTLVSLFTSLSLPVIKLNSGYKGYRNHVNAELPKLVENVNLITLYGKTGTGKTNILNKLEELGYSVLDLESYANHRGSFLGSVGLSEQNSQKMFESLLFDGLRSSEGFVFTEGESRRIGKVMLSQQLYNKLLSSRKFYIEASLENRVDIIKEEYLQGEVDTVGILESLERLRRYISEERIDKYVSCINNKEYDFVIEDLINKYYDKNYKSSDKEYEVTFNNDNLEICVNSIVNYVYN